METCVAATQATDLAFVFGKLFHTIDCYAGRFPELRFLHSGLAQVKDVTGERFPELRFLHSGLAQVKDVTGEREDNLQVLLGLQAYMQNKLFVYYVIRIMDPGLQQDIESLKKGDPVNRESDLYLGSL
jgi:hypothetical protein